MSDWDRSNAFYRDVLGAEVVPIGAGRSAYAFGDQRLNVHGPDTDVGSLVATEPVRPGNGDLCFVWPGPIEEAVEHLRAHEVELEAGPVERAGGRGQGSSVYFRDPGRLAARAHLVRLNDPRVDQAKLAGKPGFQPVRML